MLFVEKWGEKSDMIMRAPRVSIAPCTGAADTRDLPDALGMDPRLPGEHQRLRDCLDRDAQNQVVDELERGSRP